MTLGWAWGIMVVRLGVWGSMGRAKGVLSCHFIKQKKIFNVHFFLAILSCFYYGFFNAREWLADNQEKYNEKTTNNDGLLLVTQGYRERLGCRD